MATIYISSTYSDLKECRERVYRALRQLRHDVIAMEDYVASDRRPLQKCLEDVARCDIYVGIFAWRYGFIPTADNPDKRSITELEYRHALECGIPTLIFLLDEDAPWPPSQRDRGKKSRRIKSLRAELLDTKVVSFFRDNENLALLVSNAVTNTVAELESTRAPFMADDLPADFVERPEKFEPLVEILLAEAEGPVGITTALRGAGGYGKTMLATALCHDGRCGRPSPTASCGYPWASSRTWWGTPSRCSGR